MRRPEAGARGASGSAALSRPNGSSADRLRVNVSRIPSGARQPRQERPSGESRRSDLADGILPRLLGLGPRQGGASGGARQEDVAREIRPSPAR